MNTKQIGKQLREWRKDAGLTQHDLAKKMNIHSAQIVSNWERGACFVPAKSAVKFCRACRINNKAIVELSVERHRVLFEGRM